MSIKRMTAVWDESCHKGNDLLLLLSLADHANDEGYCWPSIETLAKKTRLSESTVIRATKRMEDSGELVVNHNRRYGNRYIVATGMTEEQIETSVKRHFGEEFFLTVNLQDKSNCHGDSSELASSDSSELAQVTDDPSTTVNETSNTTADADAPQPDPPTPPQNNRDLVFEGICEYLKGVPYKRATKRVKGWANAVKGEFNSRPELDGKPPRPEELQTFKQRYAQETQGATFPKDPVKVADWFVTIYRTAPPASSNGHLRVVRASAEGMASYG